MTRNDMDVHLVQRLCRRPDGTPDPEAMDFLANYWARYCHRIDDLVDGDLQGPEELLATFALAIGLYSHPFYLRHLGALRQVALNATEIYAQTVAWEKSGEPWQRAWADNKRHVSNEMASAVATICGGYEHARAVMPELRCNAYAEHHKDGKAV